MRSVFLTFFLTAIGTLYAQSSSSQSNGTFEDSFNYINELFAKDQESIKFCKENSMGLNLLILDGYYVIDAHPNGRIANIECNTHTTRVYTEDTTREIPAWAKKYDIIQASQDSMIQILYETNKMGVGKIDRDEISVSFPYQDESIYSYKNFFKKLKNAGFTKIRLLGNKKQFSKEVYKKLQITKFSAKQMESWESTKYECNRVWLHISDSTLSYRTGTILKMYDIDLDSGPLVKKIMANINRKKATLSSIYKKFQNKLPRLKDVKNKEHPDAELSIVLYVEFTIAPDGNISRLKKLSSTSGNEDFDKAIEDAILSWHIENTEKKNITILKLPIEFPKR